jgi:hypothetical protein
MNFLNPLFFLGLTAVIGPILIHLIRKDDSPKILFSSLIFVNVVPMKSWKRQTLRHLPLLFLRIFGILLLILGFARPYFTSKASHSLQIAESRFIVVLLDNSFSMRFGDHFEKGERIAEKIINGLSENDTLQMGLFSDTVQVLNQPVRKSKDLSSILARVRPAYRKSDFVSVLQYASHQMFLNSSAGSKELHVISDFQETGWNHGGERSLDEGIQIVSHNVADSPVSNLSVNSPHFELDSNRDAHFSVQVSSSGKNNPENITVNLLLNEKLVQERKISLKPNESQLVEFDEFSLTSGIHSGQFSIGSTDLLKEDNSCYFSVSTQKPYRILILSDRIHQDNLYLSHALAVGTASPFQTEISSPERAISTDLSRYTAIALNNVSSLPPAFPSLLESYLHQGGKLWVILGNRTDINFFNSTMSRFLPAILMQKETADRDPLKWHVGKIDNRHRIFEIFSPTNLSQLRTISFSGRIRCQIKEGSQVLASFDDGQPLLLERNVGKGSLMLYCSSTYSDWNNFAFHPLFVPFVQQMARNLVNFTDAKEAYRVGDNLPLASLNPQLMKEISLISVLSGSFTHNWNVLSPSGDSLDLKEKNLVLDAFITVEEQGFYRTKVRNVDSVVAVNIDPGESQMEAFDPSVRLPAVQQSAGRQTSDWVSHRGLRQDPFSIESQQGVWRILLALALTVYITESFLSYSYDRRGLRSRIGSPGEN